MSAASLTAHGSAQGGRWAFPRKRRRDDCPRQRHPKWIRRGQPGTEVTYELTATGATDKRIDTALPGTGADREIDYQYVGTRLSRVVDKDVTQAYSYDDFGSVTRIQSTLNQGGTVFPPVNDLPSDLPPACEGQMSGADSGTTLYCFDEFERMVTARGPWLGRGDRGL